MAVLTREKDWSKTSLGEPSEWPQSLRTTLSIVLNSKFPMFLWWGPELICFYNDAYRPSLGMNGKHPSILGMKAEQAWPEIWDFIKPLIDQVLSGKGAVWFEDQFLPIFRNGHMEDVYWTFSYSPVNDESGNIAGVLVTCNETTKQVQTRFQIQESEKRFRNAVKQMPLGITILRGPNFVVEMANDTYLQLVDKKEEDFVGHPLFDSLPQVKDVVEPLLNGVISTGTAFHASDLSVTLNRYGREELGFFNLVYHPLMENNKIEGIIVVATEVTASAKAKYELAESEKQFRELVEKLNIVIDASELGTWEWDLQSDEIQYAGHYLEIFGASDSLSPDHAQHLAHVHPDDRMLRDIAVAKALNKGFLKYEARVIWDDRTTHWIEVKGKVFYDEQHQPVKLIGTVRDITQEKNRQQELFENEQRFRLLADSMPQHIWTADTEGNLNYFNQSVFAYSGLTLEQIDADGWIQIVHPDDREENIRLWTEAIVTGKDFLFEHRFRRHDGEYRWQLSRAIPQRDLNGNIQMWVGTSTDIQDQKVFTSELEKQVNERTKELLLLNESLAKSEERYHLMVEEVEDYAILYLSREGIIENWNKGAEKIKGYTAEEIVGKSFSIFYPDRERNDRLPEKLLQLAAEKGKVVHEGWRVRKNGSLFWASVAITAVHDAKKNVIGFSKVTHDLTEKKNAADKLKLNAEQLEQKNRDLEKMNAELQSFAYVSSHDLQEPLRKIQTFASRILSKEIQTLSETGKDYFRRMQEAAGRMQVLIQDLLAYSRTNTTDRAFEKVDLADIVHEVKSDIKETHAEKNVIIEVGQMNEVTIIPFQFRQLLYNLIGNAIKFARAGVTPHVRIETELVQGNAVSQVSLSPEKKYCHISISDNGIGFDPQYRDRIFEVFQRLHGKEEYSGTGIGLAIVKKIVENHHGVITANGELNKGATFDIYIPISGR